MKILRVALLFVLATCVLGALVAHAAKPNTGKWKVKPGSPVPPGGAKTGTFHVMTKKGKRYVQIINTPSHFVKCTGPGAQPEEIDPGFESQFGLGGPYKVSKKGKFSGSSKSGSRTQSFKGKFTTKRKARGTLRVRINEPRRKCDTGDLKWKASK